MQLLRKFNIENIASLLLVFLSINTCVYSQANSDSLVVKYNLKDTISSAKKSFPKLEIDSSKIASQIPKAPLQPTINLVRPLFQPYLKTNGQLSIDNHYAELQNPYVRSSLVYSRLSFQGGLTLAGLPFKASAFYTTENGYAYRSNFINLRFDGQAYKKRIKDDLTGQLKVSEKSMRFSSTLFDQVKKQLDVTDKQINLNQGLIDRLYADAKDSLSKSIPDSPMDTLNPNGSQLYKDSVASVMKKREAVRSNLVLRQDSLKHSRDSLFHLFDSSYMKFKEDSAKVAQLKSLIEQGPEDILSDSLSNRKTKLAGAFSNIKNFQIGQPILNHNQLGLWGTSIRGLDVLNESGKWVYGVAAGRAMDHRNMFSQGERIKYNRNIGAVQLGRKIGKNDLISLQYFYALDGKSNANPVTNQVITLGIQKSFKYLDLNLSGGNSHYEVNSPVISSNSQKARTSGNENKALLASLKFKLDYGAKVGVKWNYIGSMYTTVGNPFLRKNYVEKEFSWEQKWWKGKLSSKAFYKVLRTLENEMTPVENHTKGAGLQLQSNFSKGVNFYAMYSPYEMGNNHPDTAFRTLNKTGFASAGINYQKIWDKVMWFTQGSYSNSILLGDDVTPTRNEQYTYENYLNLYNKHELRATFLHNRTTPNLDSLNYSSLQLSYTQLIKQKLKAGGTIKANKFSANSSIFGISANCQTVLFKQIQCGMSYELDRVENWWGVEGMRLVSTANLKLSYTW